MPSTSHVKLVKIFDDCASFRQFCGFSRNEATPDRAAFVRYRRSLVAQGIDRPLFEAVRPSSKPTPSRSEPALWSTPPSSHRQARVTPTASGSSTRVSRRVDGFKAHVGADAIVLWSRRSRSPRHANVGRAVPMPYQTTPKSARRQCLSRPAFRRRGASQGSNPPCRCHRHVGPRRSRNARSSRCLEPADPSRPHQDREDLRDMKTQLRSAANAMARPRQCRRPSPPHRHRLHSQAHPVDRHGSCPASQTQDRPTGKIKDKRAHSSSASAAFAHCALVS